jgi:hypothetical protein
MPIELKQHFVAFLDILGFKEMVEADMMGQNNVNLAKLFKCHQSAAQIFHDGPDCQIRQFSDSIVISKPFAADSFEWFAIRIAQYQRLLLSEQMLCRGGIAVNKHFSNDSFTFSAGLIEAYKVESKTARYPRVVVSPEVMELIFPDRTAFPSFLVQEDDGLYFVDYIGLDLRKRSRLTKSIVAVVNALLTSADSAVREKGLWLAAYSDAVLGTSLSLPKFRGRKIKLAVVA